MARFLSILALLALALTTRAEERTLKPVAVISGADSKVTQPQFEAISSDEAWREIWASHLGTKTEDADRKAFKVDFEKYMVVAIFCGNRSNVRGMKIDDAIDGEKTIKVRYQNVGYEPTGEAETTTPYAFVILPKAAKGIRIQEYAPSYFGLEKRGMWYWARLAQIQTESPKGPFERTRAEKKKFVERLKTIKKGDKVEDVVKLLGPPFSSDVSGPKLGDHIHGTSVEYFLKKTERPNELQNQYILLAFGLDNRFEGVLSNIVDLPVKVLSDYRLEGGSKLGILDEPNP